MSVISNFYKLTARFKVSFGLLIFLVLVNNNLLASTFTEERFHSVALTKKWRYSIYLPPSYHENPHANYPVIYLLHGMYNSNRTIGRQKVAKIFNDAITDKTLQECIVVIPNGNGDSWWVNSNRYGPINDALVYDLIPHIDTKYRTINNKNNRIIAGTSMGGFGALNISLKYPSLFKTAILLSPALYQPNPKTEAINDNSYQRSFQYLMVRQNMVDRGAFGRIFNSDRLIAESYPTLFKEYAMQHENINIILYYGKQDSVTDNPTQNFIDYLQKNKVPSAIVGLEGNHSWEVWRRSLSLIFKDTPALFG